MDAFEVLLSTFRAGGKVLVCGNGGSAADAEHICGELLKKFKRRRAVPSEVAAKLRPELAAKLEGALRLTDCESGEHLDLLADRAALEAYREALDDFLKSVRENCSAAEARYLLLDSSQPFDRVFIPLLSAGGILS